MSTTKAIDMSKAQPIANNTGWVPDAPAATGWVPDAPAVLPFQTPNATMPQDTKISARPSSFGSWLGDLEADIRYGSDSTFVGKILKGMGAKGAEFGEPTGVADLMASAPLGAIRAARGVTEIPSHPWQATKDIVGGAAQAATIPGSFVAGPASEAAGDAFAARQATKQAASAVEDWQKINGVIGVPAEAVRIAKTATSLDQATTMPGRALADLGFTADELAKMTPVERMATIAPHWQQAGKAIDTAVTAATDAGQTVDVGTPVLKVLAKGISDPALRTKATETFVNLTKDIGIADGSKATPLQAQELRQALSNGARFMQGSDLGTLAGVKAELNRAVSSSLKDAVPSLKQLDQTYSDLRGAIDAAQNSVSEAAAKAPPPTMLQKAGQVAKRELPRALAYTGLGTGAYYGVRALRDMLGGP